MDEQRLKSLSDYFKTLVLLCGDILENAGDIPELSGLNRCMDGLLETLRELEIYEPAHTLSLENALGRYHRELTSLYIRFPGDPFLDGLLRRIDSLREMCAGCRENFLEMQNNG